MLSADDVKKFIELKRQELEEEKRIINRFRHVSAECIEKTSEKDKLGSENESSIKSCNELRNASASNNKYTIKDVVNGNSSKDYSEELKINVYPEQSDRSALRYEQFSDSRSDTSERRSREEVKCSPNKESEEAASVNVQRLLQKCSGLPMGMLRAGEFSPNHPDIALTSRPYEGAKHDVFVGLGLYEERRKELLHRRQKEYRDYLAKQRHQDALAKQRQHHSSIVPDDDFRIPHHQVNQDHLKSLLSPAGGWDPNQKRNLAALAHLPTVPPVEDYHIPHHQVNQEHLKSFLSPAGGWQGEWEGVGVAGRGGRRPSSVAVQTDPLDMLALDRRLTRAERELSPRPPAHPRYPKCREQGLQAQGSPGQQQQDWRMLVEKVNIGTQNNLIVPSQSAAPKYLPSPSHDNYDGDYFEALNGAGKNLFRKDSPRGRLLQDLKHTYMPSLFDEEAIKQRNMEIEQDAASKRAAYQQELKKQIEEQQRIREERKMREKLLEEAETRRLEEQLKLLKMSQETEVEKQNQNQLATRMRKDSNEFERRRLKLQTEIDHEKKAMRQARNQTKPPCDSPVRTTRSNPVMRTNVSTNETENNRSNLPFYYTSPRVENTEPETEILSYNLRRNNPHLGQDPSPKRVPYSTNIPENSIFAQSIPVKNYNADDCTYTNQRNNNDIKEKKKKQNIDSDHRIIKDDLNNVNSRNSTIRSTLNRKSKPSYEPAFLSKNITEMIDTKNLAKNRNYEVDFQDSLPIPVLREPEKNIRIQNELLDEEQNHSSEAMQNLEQKWRVPAVQKNILKNNFTEDGKQENILTQLGSIRRQLQLEQLKLDQSRMFPKQKLVK